MKKLQLKNYIKESIKKLMREQGGGPSAGPFYRIDAGGCIECPAGAGPSQCEFIDKNCTVHYSDIYSGGVGHPGGDDGGNNDEGNGNDNGTYNCIKNACVKVIGKGGVGQYATEDECMSSGCGGGPRPGGNRGTSIRGTAADMHRKKATARMKREQLEKSRNRRR